MKHLAALVASTALVAAGLAWAGPPQPAYVSAALTSGALVKASGAQSVASGDLSGDCTTSAALVTTCTKTSGVAFGYFATGTDASNLSGTLAAARLPSFTAHAVLLGTGSTGTFGTATIGTSGRVLTDNGAGTDPTFQAPAGGTGTVTSVALSAPLGGGTVTTSGTLGTTSYTAHGVLIGAGTSALNVTGAGTSPQVLTSNGASADPTFQALPSIPTGANPTATVGTSAVNGSSANFMRADAAPAINLTMAPTWSGKHTFNGDADITPTGCSDTNGVGYQNSPIDTQAGDYTVLCTDLGKTIIETSSSAQTLTIDKNANKAYTAGGLFDVLNTGTGTLTVTATSPATITQEGSGVTGNITVAPHARVKFQNVGTDLWDVVTAPGCTLWGEATASGAPTTLTISSIPAGYRYLHLEYAGSDTAAAGGALGLQFNSDTASNYSGLIIQGFNGGVTSTGSTGSTSATAGYNGGAALSYGGSAMTIDIPYYAGTTFTKAFSGTSRGMNTSTLAVAQTITGGWNNTAAINAITMKTTGTAYATGSKLSVYTCN